MKVTSRQQAVLDALDQQIADLKAKLARYQPLKEELAQLERARAVLLGIQPDRRRYGTLTRETVAGVMRDAGRPLTPREISEATGASGPVVRSHLHRGRGEIYEHDGNGWTLVDDGSEG